MRPLVELTGFDSEAKVNGAPISLSDDIVFVRPIVCGGSLRLRLRLLGSLQVAHALLEKSCGVVLAVA